MARLLATDNAFNLAFSSKITPEEKYELAKTKFTNLTQEDFLGFLKKLQEVQEKELSQEELEQITGGQRFGKQTCNCSIPFGYGSTSNSNAKYIGWGE